MGGQIVLLSYAAIFGPRNPVLTSLHLAES